MFKPTMLLINGLFQVNHHRCGELTAVCSSPAGKTDCKDMTLTFLLMEEVIFGDQKKASLPGCNLLTSYHFNQISTKRDVIMTSDAEKILLPGAAVCL